LAAAPGPTQIYQSEKHGIPHVDGYELIRVLGQGGMGVVYEARDLTLNRLVAIKMIRTPDHFGLGRQSVAGSCQIIVRQLQRPAIVILNFVERGVAHLIFGDALLFA
jgi:hypothetical protein